MLEHVLADMHAGGKRDGERQEAQSGQQRARAEPVLHVQRDQQERAEQGGGGREHHDQATADAAVREPLDAQQRLGAAPLDADEGDQSRQVRR